MPRSVKIAVSQNILEDTNIVSHLSQFQHRHGVQCGIVEIPHHVDADQLRKGIAECNIALITPQDFPKIAQGLSPSLKWIHSAYAGVEQLTSLHPDRRESLQHCTITRGTNAFTTRMAEYTIGAIIAMEKHIPRMIKRTMENSWIATDMRGCRPLNEINVGILGVGEIGQEVARLCSCLGMTVLGMKTSLEPVKHVDKIYTSNQLTELLQACDYVCNVLPSTSKTRGLLSDGVLKVCENKPIRFINIGRGDIIDERSLVEALKNGWIEKAFLDVFEKEPLPTDSPLWSFENVTITPHVGCGWIRESVPQAFIENLENYLQGKEMKYHFRWDKGY